MVVNLKKRQRDRKDEHYELAEGGEWPPFFLVVIFCFPLTGGVVDSHREKEPAWVFVQESAEGDQPSNLSGAGYGPTQ
jgi:hypothetical protein